MREARLGDVVASMKNGIYKPATEYADDGMPCLRMYNIDAGGIVWRDIKRMRINDREFTDYGLHEGDLLVNRVNSRELVGKAAYIPASLEPSVFESKNIRLRLDRTKALPKFINYQLFARGSRHFANNAQQVVGMASISQGQLADFPIVLTGLDEQHNIVAEIEKQFSRLDEAVANLQRVKANLKRYKAAVLDVAFAGDLVERTTASTDEIKWPLPQGWAWTTYSAIGEVTTGFTPPTADRANFGGNTPFFKPTDLEAGDNVVMAREYLSEAGLSKGRRLRAGSVLVTCIGATIGKTGLARVECATNQQINAVVPKPDVADSRFVYWWTVSPRGQAQIHENASATTLPILNKSKFAALAVPLPPLVEQHRIVAEVDRRLSIVRGVEAEVDANLKRAQALRQAVLQRAFASP